MDNKKGTTWFRSLRSSDLSINAAAYAGQQVQEATASLISKLGTPDTFDVLVPVLFTTDNIDGTIFVYNAEANQVGLREPVVGTVHVPRNGNLVDMTVRITSAAPVGTFMGHSARSIIDCVQSGNYDGLLRNWEDEPCVSGSGKFRISCK